MVNWQCYRKTLTTFINTLFLHGFWHITSTIEWPIVVAHCVDIWNCRYLEFYQGPMTVYLPLYSTILSVSFFYEVPLESIYNPHIIEITTISFYAVSASPCQWLIRPVQRLEVSWFMNSISLVWKLGWVLIASMIIPAMSRASHRLGPLTLSVTSHWSSHPSLGHLTFALPGFLIGAGHSWNSTTPMTYVDTGNLVFLFSTVLERGCLLISPFLFGA